MRVLFVFALAACGPVSHVSTGPAWPRASAREVDGGESLAPRAAARTIAARVEDDRPAERAADKPAAPAAAPAATGDRPAAASASPAQPEEIPGEEIVIEIDD